MSVLLLLRSLLLLLMVFLFSLDFADEYLLSMSNVYACKFLVGNQPPYRDACSVHDASDELNRKSPVYNTTECWAGEDKQGCTWTVIGWHEMHRKCTVYTHAFLVKQTFTVTYTPVGFLTVTYI